MASEIDKQELQRQLAAATQGDEAGWEYVINAYSHRVFCLIRSKCGDEELAEEITQSTFCTVAAKIGSYNELGKFEAWLFRIAVNRLRDEMRRRQRQARPMENEMIGILAGGTERPEEPGHVVLDEDLGRLREALTHLSGPDKEIIHMRHVAGLSFRQIAEVLDAPLGTVLARRHRALAKLRKYMDSEAEDQNPGEEGAIAPQEGR